MEKTTVAISWYFPSKYDGILGIICLGLGCLQGNSDCKFKNKNQHVRTKKGGSSFGFIRS